MSNDQTGDKYDHRRWVNVTKGWQMVYADGELHFIVDEAYPEDPDDPKWDDGWQAQHKMYSFSDAIANGLLAAVRKGKGHTQKQLAALLDVSVKVVGFWEQGLHTPTGDNRRKLETYITTGIAEVPDRLPSPITATALLKATAACANLDEAYLLDEILKQSPIVQRMIDEKPERFNLVFNHVRQLMARRSIEQIEAGE